MEEFNFNQYVENIPTAITATNAWNYPWMENDETDNHLISDNLINSEKKEYDDCISYLWQTINILGDANISLSNAIELLKEKNSFGGDVY